MSLQRQLFQQIFVLIDPSTWKKRTVSYVIFDDMDD